MIEGQGSLLHPAYPGGFEILAAARPDAIVLQHAPARVEYDGFPGQALHPLLVHRDVHNVGVVIVTPDRGLASDLRQLAVRPLD